LFEGGARVGEAGDVVEKRAVGHSAILQATAKESGGG
jgi:hypothetical protein